MDHHSKSLLLELVIVIAVFALASTVLVNLFVGGWRLGKNAEVRDRALGEAQCLADGLYAAEDNAEYLREMGFTVEDRSFVLSRDGFRLTVSLSVEYLHAGRLDCAEVSAESDGTILFTLPVSRFVPGEAHR